MSAIAILYFLTGGPQHKSDGSGHVCRVIDSDPKPKRPLGPQKMLKNGLHWVTTNHGNLTHLIFVGPHSVLINYGN